MISQIIQIQRNNQLQKYLFYHSDIIGNGNYGKVYKGKALYDAKQVAIKTVEMSLHQQEQQFQFIKNQLYVHQMINHERVIDCVDVFDKNGVYYFITQYLNEGDLLNYIKQKDTLYENQAIYFLKQIAEGLLYLKQNKIIHRDIKPANILLKNGQVKIADFGLAIFSREEKNVNKFCTGSPYYMSPQSLREGIYTFQGDVWALAIVFIEMITGSPPLIECLNVQQITSRVINELDVSSLKISTKSQQLLIRMLDINYQTRISIEDILQHPALDVISKHRPSFSTIDSEYFLELDQDICLQNNNQFDTFSESKIFICQNKIKSKVQVRKMVEYYIMESNYQDGDYHKLKIILRKLICEQSLSESDLECLTQHLQRKINKNQNNSTILIQLLGLKNVIQENQQQLLS